MKTSFQITPKHAAIGGGVILAVLLAFTSLNGRADRIAKQELTIESNAATIAGQEQQLLRLQAYNDQVAGEISTLEKRYNALSAELQELSGDRDAMTADIRHMEQRAENFQDIINRLDTIQDEMKMLVASPATEGFADQIITANNWDLHRITDMNFGTISYGFRRGQQTLLINNLDPEGQAAIAACIETGNCVPVSIHTLSRHNQDDAVTGEAGTAAMYRVIDWDARVVFYYYTHDTGLPVQAHPFSSLANAAALHAKADELRQNSG